MMPLRSALLPLGLLFVTLTPALAQDGEEPETFEPVEALRNEVQVSTKVVQPAIVTPASVSVVTRDQIARAGYRSVAEALAQVPGFYVSYDLVGYNVAVRGAFGGARAGSRLLKIMIDGVPVPFSQSETYLLGPEFVPITSVDRIEVLRGPASSLYGAGAYAGAINIVTRQDPYEGKITASAEIRGYQGLAGINGTGGDGTVQIIGGTTNVLLGAAGVLENRSGLSYPDPADYDGDVASWLQLRRDSLGLTDQTSEDQAQPAVVFGRATQVLGGGRLVLFGVGQFSSRDAEFSDLTVLSHDTRQAVNNWKVAAAYDRPLAVGLSATARASVAGGSTLASDQIYVSGEPFFYNRALSFTTTSGAAEVRYDFPNLGFVLLGGDAMFDAERLPDINSVDLATGTDTDLNIPFEANISNFAGYLQAVYPFTPGVALAAGGRLDAWQSTPTSTDEAQAPAPDPLSFLQANARVALNLDYQDRFAVKMIGGTAFKAASPEQLYIANPIPNNLEGDPTIQPQRLFGAEGVVEGYPTKTLLISASVFANQYRDTIGYQLVQGEQLATSYDADNLGGELSARLHQPVQDKGFVDAQLNVSLQNTTPLADADVTTDPFVSGEPGKDFPDNEAVPQVMTYARLSGELSPAHVALVVEHRYIGERTPSQSNLLRCTVVNMASPCYALPSYHVFDVALSSTTLWVDDKQSFGIRGLARVENLLDARYLEVGFNGVDVPGLPRTFWLRADILL
ncbi:MAG: TonB-dependent receptor [Myxococcales bacterium]|nr:TonB-dependent receptor [Myxococcales bacterium]